MKDLNGTFIPYFRIKPNSGIAESLILEVILPKSLSDEVYFEKFKGETESAVDVVKMNPRQDEHKFIFKKEIINPEPEHIGYKIRWGKGNV